MKLYRVLLLFAAALALTSSAQAQAPPSWIDVVATYGADPTCTMDSGPAINNAIASVQQPGRVIFFPAGCYLINTQIVDQNPAGGITYLGLGHVNLEAGTKLPNRSSMFQLGGASPVARRRLSNLVFQCSSPAPTVYNGIEADNLVDSVFDDVEIRDCAGYGLWVRPSSNGNVPGNVFNEGVISTTSATGSGVFLSISAVHWTFNGTSIIGPKSSPNSALSSSGVGIEVENAGFACFNCIVRGWRLGLAAGLNAPVRGLEISGGIFDLNEGANIRIGTAGDPTWKVYGLSIHGARISGYSSFNPTYCIDLEQVDGFQIASNVLECATGTIRALRDIIDPLLGQTGGADNGVVGPNAISGSRDIGGGGFGPSAPYVLQGKNISLFSEACVTELAPANCGVASSGIVALPAGQSSLVVDDPFVSATSRIVISEDSTLGPEYTGGITCNTMLGRTYTVTAKTPGSSFTITASTPPVGNPACLTFHIEN